MPRFAAVLFTVVGLLAVTGQAQQNPAVAVPVGTTLATLKTTAESSEYKSTSTYDDVVKFMKAAEGFSPALIHYTTYGTTYEGRAMPLAVVGTGLKDASPEGVKATGKLRVHIQGNIHAGEVEGKEAAQVLLREFAKGLHADWLSTTVFLITPIFNADGNEKFAMTNRGPQNGPINGQGTRANGQNLNINRDFMKLETPEGTAFVKLWKDYDPHVGFDLHTSDGSSHGYYLTYSPPLNPDTSPLIMKIMKDEWFPFVTRTIKAQYGWDTFYYGNVSVPGGRGGRGRGGPAPADAAGGRGAADAGRAGAAGAGAAGAGRAAGQAPPPAAGRGAAGAPTPEVFGGNSQPGALREWATFEHVPRFHNNYVGMRNRFALLSEAYAYATFEDRIKATSRFMDAALTFAHRNADRLKKACADADKELLVGKMEATRAQMTRGGTVEIIMGEVEPEKNPNNGANMNRRVNVVHPEQMVDRMWFEPSMSEDVPTEYYVPADATKAIELLQKHGIQMRQLSAPVHGVEQFAITSNTARQATASIDTGSHGLRTLEGSWQPAPTATVPAGAWAVPLNQPLARLAFYLLAPTSDDGVLAWNFLDDLLKDAKTYPIARKK